MKTTLSGTAALIGAEMKEYGHMPADAVGEYATQMAAALLRVAAGTEDGPSYPIHDKMKTEMKDHDVDIEAEPYRSMLEVVGEYEHGSADCPILVELYAVAMLDMVLCIHYMDDNVLKGGG